MEFRDRMDFVDLAEDLAYKYMESGRPSIFAGRGPCYSDLDGGILFNIFYELDKLNSKYGEDFIKLVDSIPSMGATEFLNAFYDFARHDFIFEENELENNQRVVEGITDRRKKQDGACQIGAGLGIFNTNKTEEEANKISSGIKRIFYHWVRKHYAEKYHCENQYGYYFLERTEINKEILKIIDPEYRRKCEWQEAEKLYWDSLNKEGYSENPKAYKL